MAVDTPAKIAIVGAGPVGLEAALYARALGYEVVVYDAGDVCGALRREPDRRVWAPATQLISPLAVKAILNQDADWRRPGADEVWTAGQWWERYLQPLAESDLVVDFLRPNERVEAIARRDWRRFEAPDDHGPTEDDRGGWDFFLSVQTKTGRRLDTADVVIDASGLALAGGLADGGLRHLGQDLVSTPAKGKRTLVLGDSADVVDDVNQLLARKSADASLEIVWATAPDRDRRPGGPIVMEQGPNDPAWRAAAENVNAVAIQGGSLRWLAGVWLRQVERQADSFVATLDGETAETLTVDAITGRPRPAPDWSIVSNLRVATCPTWASLPTLSLMTKERVGGANGRPIAAGDMPTPEPNFYVAGEKSFGYRQDYRFFDGLAQVRAMMAILNDRPELDLYADRTPWT